MGTNHSLRLGMLLGNLQSVESLLRIYLVKVESQGGNKESYWDLVEGDVVDEDEFSNYDTLGQLISKYNGHIAARNSSLAVDSAIVNVRDLLAHGRIAGKEKDTATLKIVKFTRPSGGKVTVSVSVLMDDGWFDANTALCRQQIEKVALAVQKHAV